MATKYPHFKVAWGVGGLYGLCAYYLFFAAGAPAVDGMRQSQCAISRCAQPLPPKHCDPLPGGANGVAGRLVD